MAKNLLAKVLKEKGISKRQFAKKIKKAYREAFRYTEPGYDPKLSTLASWAKALKCKIRDLYKE